MASFANLKKQPKAKKGLGSPPSRDSTFNNIGASAAVENAVDETTAARVKNAANKVRQNELLAAEKKLAVDKAAQDKIQADKDRKSQEKKRLAAIAKKAADEKAKNVLLKNPVGRPAISNKTAPFSTKFTPEFKRKLKIDAVHLDMDMSEIIEIAVTEWTAKKGR